MPEIANPLPSELKRRIQLAEREAAGEVTWTDELDSSVTSKIFHVYTQSVNTRSPVEEVVRDIRAEHGASQREIFSIEETLLDQRFTSEDRLDCLAALSYALDICEADKGEEQIQIGFQEWENSKFDGHYFRKRANDILLSYRVEWTFVGQTLSPRTSEPFFAAITKPTSGLLSSNPNFTKVSRAFEKALTELGQNDDPGDAITDAATALQEMFRALGIEGGSIGRQINEAKKKGLLTPWDAPLVDIIDKAAHWVEAERSNNGDAHHDASDAQRDNAWLTIHIVGALILRLSGEDLRGRGSDQ